LPGARWSTSRGAFADIADHELHGASERGVGTVASTQRVTFRIHPGAAAERAADDDGRAEFSRRLSRDWQLGNSVFWSAADRLKFTLFSSMPDRLPPQKLEEYAL
jgi:hypothetical protein